MMRYVLIFLGVSFCLMLLLSLLPGSDAGQMKARMGNLAEEGLGPNERVAIGRIRARRRARHHRKKFVRWLGKVSSWGALGIGIVLLLAWAGRFRALAIALAVLGSAALVLHIAYTRWVARQFAPALECLALSLQRTNSFYGALDFVAATGPWPISREFARLARNLQRGATEEQALDILAKRHPVPEIEMVVAALGRTPRRGQALSASLLAIKEMIEGRREIQRTMNRHALPYQWVACILLAILLVLGMHRNAYIPHALGLILHERRGT